MNPSATGWIKKLQQIISKDNSLLNFTNEQFYVVLRKSGFIYGNNINCVNEIIEKKDLSDEEICKINLFLALQYIHDKSNSQQDLVESIIDFYTEIDAHKTSVFQGLLGGKKTRSKLEKIIHKRIQINDNILTKNFNYFVINALLFVDVLAYNQYLETQHISSNYIKNLEAAIEVISLDVLQSKVIKTKYDESLIKLFISSRRYQNNTQINYLQAITFLSIYFERQYILDIACMATWGDKIIDKDEQQFLYQLGEDLKLENSVVTQSIEAVNSFYTTNKNNIALLSSKNIIKTFYDNSSKLVSKLINRNGKRLKKELIQSKDLMVLLSQSTVRDLNKDEQRKVQEQLFDIFKSIPSLAIFILPGGALLLPLFVKFIPKLLPSAFDDNRIEDDN
jgi:LETM1-like, RBD